MKSSLIILFTICLVHISCGQSKLKIEKSENYKLIKALNNSELIGENKADYLLVKIYKIDNGTVSAELPSSEVSHNLLIAFLNLMQNRIKIYSKLDLFIIQH